MPTTYAIPNGRTVFDATTYNGAGAGQTITNAGGFQPDFVWMKCRNTTGSNILQNSVVGATKGLESNNTNAEFTDASTLTAFTSTGFTAGGNAQTNSSGNNYVAWQWKANGAGSSNTQGSITSTVSVNTTAGFSIVTWTGNGTAGATVGHGLGVAPSLILPKVRSRSGDNWHCYHSALGGNQGIILNTSAGATTDSGFWNNTNPTSTVFTVGTYNTFSSQTYVAYCWAPIAGYSAFGSYTGNGSSDGPFVYLGFRPRYVMFKRTDSGAGWLILDAARNTFNVMNNQLYANATDAESGGPTADFLSNGFKIRETGVGTNANGGTYIYAAFAENPLKYATAR